MNPAETVMLARYVRALCPQQKFDEYTPDAWYDLLKEYDLEACKQAAVTLGRRQPFIAPAEIIDEVRRSRHDRLQSFQYDPDPDESVHEYLARLRSQIADVVEGRRAPELPAAGVPRPVAALTAVVGQDIPDADLDEPTATATRVRTALDVTCPACKAAPRKSCKSTFRGRRLNHFHPSRIDASKES